MDFFVMDYSIFNTLEIIRELRDRTFFHQGKRAGTGWIADPRRIIHAHHISHCLRKSSLFEESTIYFFLLCSFIVNTRTSRCAWIIGWW
jgi:hypothetical protein